MLLYSRTSARFHRFLLLFSSHFRNFRLQNPTLPKSSYLIYYFSSVLSELESPFPCATGAIEIFLSSPPNSSGISVNEKSIFVTYATTMFFANCCGVLVTFLTNNLNGCLGLTSETPFVTLIPTCRSRIKAINK